MSRPRKRHEQTKLNGLLLSRRAGGQKGEEEVGSFSAPTASEARVRTRRVMTDNGEFVTDLFVLLVQ